MGGVCLLRRRTRGEGRVVVQVKTNRLSNRTHSHNSLLLQKYTAPYPNPHAVYVYNLKNNKDNLQNLQQDYLKLYENWMLYSTHWNCVKSLAQYCLYVNVRYL